ncbi:MAG: AtpZ/AtpI family protein [Isosphaeraceae bacterium]
MPRSEDEPRSNLSVGMTWASRVSTIGLEFVVPALLGVWVDRRFDTTPTLTLIGAFLGFSIGITHLLRIAREGTSRSPR